MCGFFLILVAGMFSGAIFGTTYWISVTVVCLSWGVAICVCVAWDDSRQKKIHDGLVEVCDEHNASCNGLLFQAEMERRHRTGPEGDYKYWHHCIQVRFESNNYES
jgi:hypothetical protein